MIIILIDHCERGRSCYSVNCPQIVEWCKASTLLYCSSLETAEISGTGEKMPQLLLGIRISLQLLLAYFPFWRKKVGLWDQYPSCMSICLYLCVPCRSSWTCWLIFMKSGMDIMPLKATSISYTSISCNQ